MGTERLRSNLIPRLWSPYFEFGVWSFTKSGLAYKKPTQLASILVID